MTLESLEELRAVKGATVYKGGVAAATLTRSEDGTTFSYSNDYLDGRGPAVATTLPLSDKPLLTSAGAVPPFFAGLLPEGRRLSSLRRAVKTSADDELSLLLAIGGDTVGDVQVVPEGVDVKPEDPLLLVERKWSEVRFADLLAEINIDRVGLPGVQEKVSARMISVPLKRAGKRFILKVNPPEYPNVVENEAFFLALAHQTRIPSATAEIVQDAEGESGLLVTRFDRVPGSDGSTTSLAFEDACQVLGLWPADKYNVSCEQIVDALAERCPARSVAARNMFEQVCFAWLTGNGDLHAKNIAILATLEGEWRVAPAYDLPSTVPYRDKTFAIPLQGRTKGISRRRLLEFGAAVGLPERVSNRTLDQLLDRISDLDNQLAEGVLPFAADTIADVRAELRHRRGQATSP